MNILKSLNCGDLSFKTTDYSPPWIGFAVSTKYGNAVKRNLFKRRCRFAYKTLICNKGVNLSIIVLPKKKNISYNSIYKAFTSLNDKFSN